MSSSSAPRFGSYGAGVISTRPVSCVQPTEPAHSIALRMFMPAMGILSGHEIMKTIGTAWTAAFRTRLFMMVILVIKIVAMAYFIALYNDGEGISREDLKIFMWVFLGVSSAYLVGEIVVLVYEIVSFTISNEIVGHLSGQGTTALTEEQRRVFGAFKAMFFTHRSYQWVVMLLLYVSFLMTILKFCDHDALGFLNRYWICVLPGSVGLVASTIWFIVDHFSRKDVKQAMP